MLKYFPIALITTIESSFRILIADLIDNNEQCLQNSEKFLKSYKIDFNIMKALYGKDITLGNFIAHIVSINTLDQINSHISNLIDKDFLGEIKSHFSRWDVEIKKLPKVPMMEDPSNIYSDVAKTFELRHIFAHETATNVIINIDQIRNLFKSNVSFLNTSSDYVNEFIYPDAPLTQTDMNIHSGEELEKLLSEIDKLNLEYKNTLDETRQQEFEEVEKAWKNFMETQARFEMNEYKGGTIMSTIFNGTASSLAHERKQYMESMIKYADE